MSTLVLNSSSGSMGLSKLHSMVSSAHAGYYPGIDSYISSVPAPAIMNELVDVVTRCVSSVIPITIPTINTMLPSLVTFVEQVAYSAKAIPITFLCSIVYLDRVRSHLPVKSRGNHETHHRIFLAAIILATKHLYDVPLKNKHWAACSRVFSCAETNLMELQFLKLLDYNMEIKVEEIEQVYHRYILNSPTRRASISRPYICGTSLGVSTGSCKNNFNFHGNADKSSFMYHGDGIARNTNNGSFAPLMNSSIASSKVANVASRKTSASNSILAHSSGVPSKRGLQAHSNNFPATMMNSKVNNHGGAIAKRSACVNSSLVHMNSQIADAIMYPENYANGDYSSTVGDSVQRIDFSPGELEILNELIYSNDASSNAIAAAPVSAPRPVSFSSYQVA